MDADIFYLCNPKLRISFSLADFQSGRPSSEQLFTSHLNLSTSVAKCGCMRVCVCVWASSGIGDELIKVRVALSNVCVICLLLL